MMRIKEQFDKKLLVEGNDDQHVIWALCEKFQIHENFDIIDSEGVDKLLESIPVRLKQSGLKTLAFIIDADTNLKKSWLSLSALLQNLGFVVPHELPSSGLIIKSSGIKIGVWVMPNNSLNGMLEDFISFLVPKDDELFSFANHTLKEIEQQGINKYASVHRSKALVHTWLSWQEDPGTPLGLAITKRYLTTDEKTCLEFINWLKETFNS